MAFGRLRWLAGRPPLGGWPLVLFAALSGCGLDAPSGSLAVGAPLAKAAARQLLVIPDGTTQIVVRVTGDGIPTGAVLATTLTPDHTNATFTGVPVGAKTIDAKCYDAQDGLLASGQATVTIEAGKTASAHIVMAPLSDEGGFNLVIQ